MTRHAKSRQFAATPLLAVLTLAASAPALIGQASQPADSVYSTPAVRQLVASVAAANRALPADLASYSARVESEMSFVRVEPDGRETVLQLEQIASDAFWRSDGGLSLEMIGYRAQTLGPTFSALSMFEVPWVVPTLYGERLDLVRTSSAAYSNNGTLLVRRTLHPFAAEREAVYRFSGGDTTVVINLRTRQVPIVRIHVEPVSMPSRPTLLFQGDVDVDVTRMQIVAMRGRLFDSDVGRSFLSLIARGALYVDFQSTEYDELYWLPHTQRFEVQVFSRLEEGRVLFRVISRFVRIEPNDPDGALRAAAVDSLPSGRLAGGEDVGVLSSFGDWQLAIGELGEEADARDFDAYAPSGFLPTGAPRVFFGAQTLSQLFRMNEVEGLYTGAGVTLDAGDALPGLRARWHAGWAWSEGVARGGMEIEQRWTSYAIVARGERTLTPTQDFLYPFQREPDAPSMFGAKDFHFVDRRYVGVVGHRVALGTGIGARAEISRVWDRPAGEPLDSVALGAGGLSTTGASSVRGTLSISASAQAPLLSPVADGSYWRTRLELRRHPSAGGLSLEQGLMLRLSYEGAQGELEWQRVEAGAALRRSLGRWTFWLSGDAGALLSEGAPPQALFELGATANVPGAEDRVFAGDRAALGRATMLFELPFLGAPVKLGSLWLPAPAPSPSIGVRVGWTDASARTLDHLNALGWETSNGARSTLDVRLRFFGSNVSVGAARPLEKGGRWRFVWSLVSEL
jgi:hypothetical protein